MDYELYTFHHELERVHLRGQIDLKHKYMALKGDTSISKEITTERKVLVQDHAKIYIYIYIYILQVDYTSFTTKKNPLKFIIFENYLVVLIQLYLRRAIEL